MGDSEAIKRRGKKVYAAGLIVIAVFVIVFVLCRTIFFSVNRSSEAVAKATFNGIYDCNFAKFVKATIYNEDCQKALNMDISADLSEIESSFKEMKAWMKETGESYRVLDTRTEEYDALSDKYKEAITLFREAYDGVKDNLIEKVAFATVSYEVRYADETGKWLTEQDEEQYWCFYIDGKWYSFPMLGALE